jgi:hypothetical protein
VWPRHDPSSGIRTGRDRGIAPRNLAPDSLDLGAWGSCRFHRSALAATAAAREAGFDAARTSTLRDADGAIAAAVRQALQDQGLDPALVRVRWEAAASLERGDAVEVEVAYPVTVVQAPLLGRVAGPSVWVHARHIARVDPYRSLE